MKFLEKRLEHGGRSRAPLGPWAALLLLAMTLLTAYPAFAQTGSGVLLGRVVDASNRAPAADVVVTATSPALQGEQLVVTDGTGQYRIPNLPPGDYTLRFEKDAFKPYARGGIAVRAATTIRVNVELLPEALKAEEIVVVGRAPTVDVGSSSVGQSITQDFTRRIAVSPPTGKGAATRSFESLAATAPGAQADEYGTSIAGTSSPENQYVIDGLSVNDPAYGIVGTPLSMEFIKEVNVVTGGYMPEFGRATGGVLERRHQERLQRVPRLGLRQHHARRPRGRAQGGPSPGRDHPDGRGPVVHPRLRRSRSAAPSSRTSSGSTRAPMLAFKSNSMERNLFATRYDPDHVEPVTDRATGLNVVDRLPGTQRFYRAEEQTLQYLGKLTYQINPDHSVALSVYGSPSTSGGNGTFGFDPQQGVTELSNIIGEYGAMAHEYVASSTDVALKWSSAFKNKTLLLDATLGWHGQRNARLPPDGSELGTHEGLAGVPLMVWQRYSPNPYSIDDFETLSPRGPGHVRAAGRRRPAEIAAVPCAVRQYWQGGPDFIDDASLNRFQLKAMVTSIFEGLGHHVVKAGIDGEITTYKHIKAYAGGTTYVEEGDWDASHDERQLGFLTGPDGLATGPGARDYVIQDKLTVSSLGATIGAFVQDSWSILDQVTLNIGVRYDAQYLYASDGKLGLALANQWSPRVGVVYDITQEGRSKVFANYARYYESVPLDMLDRAFGDERYTRSYHRGGASGCNPGDPEDATGYGEGQCRNDDNRVRRRGLRRPRGLEPRPEQELVHVRRRQGPGGSGPRAAVVRRARARRRVRGHPERARRRDCTRSAG